MSEKENRRAAAALLLVYPATLVASNALTAVERGGAGYFLYRLPITFGFLVLAIALSRGARWASRAGPAAAAGLLTIIPLYLSVVYRMYGVGSGAAAAFGFVRDLVVPAAAAAALWLLVRRGSAGRELARDVAVTLAVEAGLVAVIAAVGIGGFPGTRPWYREALELTQVPAYLLLQSMGFCCGYYNGTLVSDDLAPHWGAIRPAGLPTLMAANAFALLPLLWMARGGLRRLRRGTARGELGSLPPREQRGVH